jgi:hypothetical protein
VRIWGQVSELKKGEWKDKCKSWCIEQIFKTLHPSKAKSRYQEMGKGWYVGLAIPETRHLEAEESKPASRDCLPLLRARREDGKKEAPL